RVITVGAVSNSQILAPDVIDVPQADDPALMGAPFGRAFFGAEITAPIGPLPYKDVATAGAGSTPYACAPLPSKSLEGQAALIQRGQCNFADKVYYAQQAGALAAVIYNETDEQAVTQMACGGDFCDPGEITIPAVLVSRTFGQAALQWLSEHPTATLRIDPTGRIIPDEPNVVWPQSGRGPAFMRFGKPDLVAPGVAVLGAVPSGGYEQYSGTSQAAAHVAGAVALLLQRHSTWSHEDIKTALLASAEAVRVDPSTELDALSYGAGRLRVDLADAPVLLANPNRIDIADARPGQRYRVTIALKDPRVSGRAITYNLLTTPVLGLSFEMRTQITMQPGSQRNLEVDIVVASGTPPGPLATTIVFSSSERQVRVPVFVSVVSRLASADVLVIDNDFS
ncbi:MAG: S8 family serine peptidase, partial [Chloroflexi bacterium]|nr:S8 family serine peptidase [Chloroflexota bacterium]